MTIFKKGDKVRLVSKAKHQIEERNWINLEPTKPEIGNTYIVNRDDGNSDYIGIEGLVYYHPKTKFEKV